MNKLIFLVVMASISLASAAHEINQPHVSVYGTAEQKVVPNLMHWNISVANKGTDLQSVSSQHTNLVKKAIKVISSAGIKNEKIQTNNMQFGENWVYRNQSQIKEGYTASTNIYFALDDLEKYESLWLELAKIPELSIRNVNYDHTDKVKLQNEVRKEALLAAQKKALALAATLGQELGEALVISEDTESDFLRPVNTLARGAMLDREQAESALSPGTITINMQIKLVVSLITS